MTIRDRCRSQPVVRMRAMINPTGPTCNLDCRHRHRDRMFLVVPAQTYILKLMETFKEDPPPQKPMGSQMQDATERLQKAIGGQWQQEMSGGRGGRGAEPRFPPAAVASGGKR